MDEKRKVRGTSAFIFSGPFFIGPDGPADSCCGGSFIKSRHYSFIFTLIYIGIALWIYFSRRKGILAGLIAFSQAYDKSKSKFLEEMLVPYCVADIAGRILWMNREMEAILGDDKATIKTLPRCFRMSQRKCLPPVEKL